MFFFIQTSPKFGQKSKQIQCKSLILLTLGLQVAKARKQFLAFFDIFGQVRYFGQFQNKLFNPETKFQISGSNWYKFHPNRTQHCLRRLKMSSLFFFVSYPVTQFLIKKKNQMKRLNADIPKNANESELRDCSKF